MPWTFLDSRGNRKEIDAGSAFAPMAKLIHTVSQTLTTGVTAQMNLGSIVIDTDNMTLTANAITIKTAGRYLLLGKIYYNGVASGVRDASIVINGVGPDTFQEGFARDTGTVGNGSVPGAWRVAFLNVGDVITLWGAQNSGGNVTTSTGPSAELEAIYIDKAIKIAQPSQTGGAQTLICSQVLGASQATFDTNTLLGGNIPQTYNHLRLMVQGRGDAASTSVFSQIRFNNDSGANYDYDQSLVRTSSVQRVASAATAGALGDISAASSTAGVAGEFSADIVNYTGTVLRKQWRGTGWAKDSADGTTSGYETVTFGGEWRNTSAITRLQVILSGGNFIAGSSFYLYGIL
jgi:hypothetical protein